MACLAVAEDKILYSVETCKVLTVSDGIVNVVCCQLVVFTFAAQLQVFVELHVALKLLLVKRPCVGMGVDGIVAGSTKEECLRKLPPFARLLPCFASLLYASIVAHGVDVGNKLLVIVGEVAVCCYNGVVNIA